MSLPIHMRPFVVVVIRYFSSYVCNLHRSGSDTWRFSGFRLGHSPGCAAHGIKNVLVACAAADIAPQRITDLFIAWVGIMLQHFVGGHQETSGTKAPFQTPLLPQSFLHTTQLSTLPQT